MAVAVASCFPQLICIHSLRPTALLFHILVAFSVFSTLVFLVGGGMSWLGGQIDRLKGRDRELINLTVVHICNVRAMDPLL